jgi:glycosyltransferase involved in cell wall biosynthesis
MIAFMSSRFWNVALDVPFNMVRGHGFSLFSEVTMPTLGLSMIVKNGGDDLRKCLASACEVVDQIVIADTGSTDDTCSIASEFGATIISVPWINDFSAARNAALLPITTDWVLFLDADQELDSDAKRLLLPLLARNDAGMGGYLCTIRDYFPLRFAKIYNSVSRDNDGRNARAKKYPSFTEHMSCRLFRHHPGIHFEGRVHERVENSIQAVGLGVGKIDVVIHHFGMLATDEERLRKYLYYRELGVAKVKDQPESAMAWMELGLLEYEAFHNREEALRCFEHCVQLDPKRTDAWTFIAMVHSDLGNLEETLKALENAGNGASGAVMREQLRGDALHDLGKLREARVAYRRALDAQRTNPLLQSKLGYTEVRLGMKQQGFARMLRAVSAAPEAPELQDRLVKAYLAAENIPQAADAAEKMADHFRSPKTIVRAASIRAHLKEWPQARHLIESGLQEFPASTELKAALVQAQHAADPVS